MKKLLLSIFALTALCVSCSDDTSSTSYYVSPTGNDSNSGDIEHPFRTINKAAYIMQAGDVCYIREGVYREEVSPLNSGEESKPITFKNYQDEEVWIDATNEIDGWERYKGNIYKSSSVHKMTALPFEFRALFHNDKVLDVARWPNNEDHNPFSFEGFSVDDGSASSVVSDKNGFPEIDLTGGAITYFGEHSGATWAREITSSNTNTINYTEVDITDWPFANHNPTISWRKNRGQIFVCNKLELLDSPEEWYFSTDGKGKIATIYAYFADGKAPQNGSVKLTTRINTMNIKKDYINIDGLNFFGGSVRISGDHCSIRNCNLQHCSQTQDSFDNCEAQLLYGSLTLEGSHISVEHNLIEHGSGNGIVMLYGKMGKSDYLIHNNVVRYFNTLGIHANPILSDCDNTVITNNTVYMCGRDGITTGNTWGGRNCEVAYNDASYCMMINNDGGIYYTVGNQDMKHTKIHHNWFHDSFGPAYADGRAAGIYLDNYSKGYDVYNNVISNVTWAGLQYNLENTDLNFYNNTIWNAGASTGHWVLSFKIDRINISNNVASSSASDVSEDNNRTRNIETEWIGTNVSKHNMIITEDMFEDAKSGNFMPKSGSKLIDAGKTIPNFTTNVKGSNPDLGAYEHGGERWVAGATWVSEVM